MLPVPKPIGGVLILAVNSLLYLNQSVPPFGVSLNSLTKGNTNFPLRNQGKREGEDEVSEVLSVCSEVCERVRRKRFSGAGNAICGAKQTF